MPNDHQNHTAASRRGGAFGDVHDIRALTDTGSIAVPVKSGSRRSTGHDRSGRGAGEPVADVA